MSLLHPSQFAAVCDGKSVVSMTAELLVSEDSGCFSSPTGLLNTSKLLFRHPRNRLNGERDSVTKPPRNSVFNQCEINTKQKTNPVLKTHLSCFRCSGNGNFCGNDIAKQSRRGSRSLMIWRRHPLECHPCERSMSLIRLQTSEVFLSGNASRFTDQHTNESAGEMERQTDGGGGCGEFTLKDMVK